MRPTGIRMAIFLRPISSFTLSPYQIPTPKHIFGVQPHISYSFKVPLFCIICGSFRCVLGNKEKLKKSIINTLLGRVETLAFSSSDRQFNPQRTNAIVSTQKNVDFFCLLLFLLEIRYQDDSSISRPQQKSKPVTIQKCSRRQSLFRGTSFQIYNFVFQGISIIIVALLQYLLQCLLSLILQPIISHLIHNSVRHSKNCTAIEPKMSLPLVSCLLIKRLFQNNPRLSCITKRLVPFTF